MIKINIIGQVNKKHSIIYRASFIIQKFHLVSGGHLMSDIRKVENTLYVSDDYLDKVLNYGDIKFMADLHSYKLSDVQKSMGI